MTDDRSERLRKRRKQSTENLDRQQQRSSGGSSETGSRTDSSSASATPDDAGRDTEDEESTVSIKEEQIGTYMYLPESQTKEMRRLYNVLKAEYEFEYEDEFQKNRHFYPLVVQYGLDSLDNLDASEIRDHLEEIS